MMPRSLNRLSWRKSHTWLLIGLASLLTLGLGLAIVSETAMAEVEPDTIEVTGRIELRRAGDGRLDAGFRPQGAESIMPDEYPLPVNCAIDVWIASSPIVLKGVQLGSVIIRSVGSEWSEVAFRQVDGADVLPVARFVRPGTATNRLVSSDISITITRPDPTPSFRSRASNRFLLLNQVIAAITLPQASVGWWDLTYSLEPEVPGLRFDPETRRLSGAPSEDGTYAMVYLATSTGGASSEMRFTIEVAARAHSESVQSEESMTDDSSYDDSMMEEDSMMDESDHMLSDDSGESEPTVQPGEVPADTTFAENPRTGFTLTRENDTSTFSLDVDLTSYQLALNWAANNYLIEPDSARAEEWINSFDYGYTRPDSDDEFAVSTAILQHPLDDELHIARIGFQAPTLPDDRPLNLALVLDASGSMAWGNRVEIARAAAETIHAGLRCIDRVAVVHFTTNVVDSLTVEGAIPGMPEVHSSIAQLIPRSSTNVQRGLNLGVQLVAEMRKQRPDAYNYVILMSDGVANVDATDPFGILEQIGDQNIDDPIRLVTVGVGINSYNDVLLEQLSQQGNGWYRYLDTPEQARQVFAREHWVQLSTPFADQARTQVIWDQERVSQWRLIGYENRVTSAESFSQDRTEFAEVPSGIAVTALYELNLTDNGKQSVESGAESFGTVELRWKSPDTGESKAIQQQILASRGNADDELRAALDEFATIVGLTADRYGAIDSANEVRGEQGKAVGVELRALQAALAELQERLPEDLASQDFARLLSHLVGSVPDPGATDN